MNPTLTPANQQTLLLDALRKGIKLYDVMKGAGMPAKATLDAWLEHEPGFKQRYQDAVQIGKAKRDGTLDEPADTRHLPAVLRGHRSPRLATQPISDFVRTPIAKPVPVMQEEKSPQVAQARPAQQAVCNKPGACPRFFFLEKPNKDTGLCRVKFVYTRRKQGVKTAVYFQTGIHVAPECWNAATKLVLPTCQDAEALNKELEHINTFALAAIAEGKNQDEVRALMDLRPTKAQAFAPKRRGPVVVPQLSPYLPEEAAPAPADEQPVVTATPAPMPTPENAPEIPLDVIKRHERQPDEPDAFSNEPTAPGEGISALRAPVEKFQVGYRVLEDEYAAANAAWFLSKELGAPVTIYRLTPQPIGVVNANPQAA